MDHLGARLNFRPVQPRSPSFWFLGFLLYLGLLWTRTCLPRLHTLRQRRSPRPNNLLSNDPLHSNPHDTGRGIPTVWFSFSTGFSSSDSEVSLSWIFSLLLGKMGARGRGIEVDEGD